LREIKVKKGVIGGALLFVLAHKIKARTPEEKARRAVTKFKSRRVRATCATLKTTRPTANQKKSVPKKDSDFRLFSQVMPEAHLA
jgi:hypothetical protein